MKNKEDIEQEVEKTLQCFETDKKIEPNPFFYTRLQAKIRSREEEKEGSTSRGWSLGYLRPALLLCLLVFNIVSAVLVFSPSENQTNSREYYLSTFVEEYALQQSEEDLFLINN